MFTVQQAAQLQQAQQQTTQSAQAQQAPLQATDIQNVSLKNNSKKMFQKIFGTLALLNLSSLGLFLIRQII